MERSRICHGQLTRMIHGGRKDVQTRQLVLHHLFLKPRLDNLREGIRIIAVDDRRVAAGQSVMVPNLKQWIGHRMFFQVEWLLVEFATISRSLDRLDSPYNSQRDKIRYRQSSSTS